MKKRLSGYCLVFGALAFCSGFTSVFVREYKFTAVLNKIAIVTEALYVTAVLFMVAMFIWWQLLEIREVSEECNKKDN